MHEPFEIFVLHIAAGEALMIFHQSVGDSKTLLAGKPLRSNRRWKAQPRDRCGRRAPHIDQGGIRELALAPAGMFFDVGDGRRHKSLDLSTPVRELLVADEVL